MAKRLLTFIFFLLLAPSAFAQATGVYTIDDFNKMLQSQVSPYLTPKNGATEARNVRSNDVYGSLAKRPAMLSYGSLGLYQITSLHRFYKSDNTAYLVGTGSTYILKGSDTGGATVILRDQLTSGLHWTWVTYQDKAIGCNGTDSCQKWDGLSTTMADTDGARTANILTADLGAPFAQLATGTDLDPSSWYQYKVQCTDGSNTWYSDAVSNPILTGSTVHDIDLTDIPLCISGATNRTIYRTEGQASRAALASATFKLVGTIADNATQTYSDTTADGALGASWSSSGDINMTPPKVKYITIHKERLFGANAPNQGSYIYWSLSFKPDVFDASEPDHDFVRIDDGDEITFIKPIIGKLVIGKTNSITNFETQSSDSTLWKFSTYSFVGCPAPYSAASTPLGIIYLGWNGLYVYNGESSQLISDVVTQEIRDVLASNIAAASGIYFNNEYQLAYTSARSGSSENNVVLLYDLTRDSYVIDDKSIESWAIFDSGNDYGTLYSGSSLTDGAVMAHDSSLSTMVLRYQSDLTAGTKDSISIDGTQNDPNMSIGWGIMINDASMAGVTLDSVAYANATIDRPGLTGTWWSPAIRVNASNYDKLYWNENLGGTGNVTFAVRSASTASAVTADSLAWSSEFTNPSGSDVSGLTANDFIQLRASLSTGVITETPYVQSLNNYVIKMVYSQSGATAETSINSVWRSGFYDIGDKTLPKRIWAVDVYYEGTSGTLTVGFTNDKGDITKSFNIDLSIDPTASSTDQYFGDNTHKIYKYLVPVNSSSDPTPTGRMWQFSVTEGGVVVWKINRIDVRYSVEDQYED